MKSILYLMHIPWGWIKQRPHFFAENLAKEYLVDVYYRKANTVSQKKLLTSEQVGLSNLSIKGFNNIPFVKIPLLKHFHLDWINTVIAYIQLPSLKQYDYIWITSPILYPVIKPLLQKHQLVIYDCMDDMIEFPEAKNNIHLQKLILRCEKQLMDKANHVFVSSAYLKNKILERSGLKLDNAVIVNNAIELPQQSDLSDCPFEIKQKMEYIRSLSFPFMYVGMVSEWFDFTLVIAALDKFPQMNVVLLGPNDIKIPEHKRIHYLGMVERKYIFPLMKEAYALMMPFILNELIYSVNPVKLYEYIFTGKPVVSVKYGETEKFSKYVNLYVTENDFFAIIDSFINGSPVVKSEKEISYYIADNTWEARYRQIVEVLES